MKLSVLVEESTSPPCSVIIGAAIALFYFFLDGGILGILGAATASGVSYVVSYFALRNRFRNENVLMSYSFVPALAVLLAASVYLGLPEIVYTGALSISAIFLFVYFLRIRWKISAHMMFFVGMCSFVSLLDFRLAALLLLAPLVAWSRLALKRHTYAQVVAGSAVGLVVPPIASQIAAVL